MVALTIVGILVLILIFFVLRSQSLQRELALTRSTARVNAKKVNYAFTNLVTLTNELQSIYVGRVETAHSKGVMGGNDYKVVKAIVSHYSQIVMDCCEKGATVEEALKKSLKMSEVSLEDIKNYIKEQPNDVRMSWVKNTPDGFTNACSTLSQGMLNKDKPAEPGKEESKKDNAR